MSIKTETGSNEDFRACYMFLDRMHPLYYSTNNTTSTL